MSDIQHSMGSDLNVGNGGDLASAQGSEAIRERVLRRLLTNPGEYIWQLSYGGGLASFVGQVANLAAIQSVVQAQMALEPDVLSQPIPTATMSATGDGIVAISVTYADDQSGSLQTSTAQIGSS